MATTGVGLPNVLFWIGVVENNFDQRLEGRVQVRVFGIHGTIEEIPTEDLPWAILIIGSHDVNFVVPPINSWVFGCFLDGRDAQQPAVLGLIPTQMVDPVDPTATGWGVTFGSEQNRLAQGSRTQDAGQPTNSRLARGEELDHTYLLAQETNRTRGVQIAGGSAPNLYSVGNMGVLSQDDGASVLPQQEDSEQTGIPFNVPRSDRAKYIKNGLISRGMPEHIAEGFLMNMYDESKLDSGVEEYSPNIYGTRGFGLIQWTGARRTALSRYAADRGKPANDVDMQLDFLIHELNTPPENNNWAKIQSTSTSGEAGAAIVALFLRPAAAHRDRRISKYTGGLGYNGIGDSSFITAGGNIASGSAGWDEPAPAYNAQYPYNRVIETSSGHSIELDDTPGNERIMIWHRNGSYIQISGTTTTHKNIGDSYLINERNNHVHIGGTNVITIEGDSHVLVKGDLVEEVMGNYRQIIHGNHEVGVAGQMNYIGGEDGQMRAARLSFESNVENLNIKTAKIIRFETGETMHFKTKNMYFESSETMNVKVGTDYIFDANNNISIKSANTMFLQSANTSNWFGNEIRIGGKIKVDISAPVVNIDDVVMMANGNALAPSESTLKAPLAESATQIEKGAPPVRSISEIADS